MAVLCRDGTVVSTNDALQLLLQRPEQDLVGRSFLDITYRDDLAAAQERCAAIASGQSRLEQHECRFVTPAGGLQWVRVSTSRPTEKPGRPPHLIMHIEDISQRKAFEDDLVHMALHDALTGLPNRVLLLDRLTHALDASRRTSAPTSVLFLDLNGFKKVNDAYGHAAGDAVLQQYAQRLRAAVRPGDTVGRLGGDEFLVLCEDTDPTAAAALAVRLDAVSREPFDLGDRGQAGLRAAVGISTAQPDGSALVQAAQLLALADDSMYEQKRDRPPPSPA